MSLHSCAAYKLLICLFQKPIILAADQLLMGGMDRELRHKEKLWRKDVESKNPFSPVGAKPLTFKYDLKPKKQKCISASMGSGAPRTWKGKAGLLMPLAARAAELKFIVGNWEKW